MIEVSFNGINLTDYVTVGKVTTSILPPRALGLLDIPGMAGAYVNELKRGVRKITVDIYLLSSDVESNSALIDTVADILDTDEAKEMTISSHPGVTFYALLADDTPLQNLSDGREKSASLNFICPDPYKYGVEKVTTFTDAGTVRVGGTADTNPVITVEINKNTTFVAVGNGDQINLIGNPVRQEQTTIDPETDIYIGKCDSLTGWTVASAISVEASDITGTMKTDGINFYTDTYGTAVGWHGPAIKRSLGQAVQDFRFDTSFFIGKTGNGQAGGVEISLLDANSLVICKLAMTKHYGELNTLYSKLRAGTITSGHDVIDEFNQANFSGSFSGVLRMYRKGNLWTAQIFKLVNGKFQTPITQKWTDKNGIAAAAVTQVQARIIQRGNFPVVNSYIGDIQVYKLNDPADNQIPIIARVGDIIEFDHQSDIIRKNGMDITKEKAFIGEYFPLVPGANSLIVEPAASIGQVEVRWRDRWR